MVRNFFAALLVLLALVLIIAVPLLVLTPAGGRVLSFISPSPTPVPSPILTVQGTPPPVNAASAYLLDADTGHTLANVQGDQHYHGKYYQDHDGYHCA